MSKFYTRSVNQYRINALDFSVDSNGVPSAVVVASCMHEGINEPRERRARAILAETTGTAILPNMAIVCTPVEAATYRIDSRVFQTLASTEKPSGCEYVSRTIKSYTTPIYEVVWMGDTQEPLTIYQDTLYTTGDEPSAKDVKQWCKEHDKEYADITWHAFADNETAITYYLPVDQFIANGERVNDGEDTDC